jgi:hypothetical protein
LIAVGVWVVHRTVAAASPGIRFGAGAASLALTAVCVVGLATARSPSSRKWWLVTTCVSAVITAALSLGVDLAHDVLSPAKPPTVTVVVSNKPGGPKSATLAITVQTPPAPHVPVNTQPPSIAGTTKIGHRLSCLRGSWVNAPTRYSDQWNAYITPIDRATGPTYTVEKRDEGLTLTCTVKASNNAGSGTATSLGAPIPVPAAAPCPRAKGGASGQSLGLVTLGMTRAQARKAYTHWFTRGRSYEDFFCLTPVGVRVGYASAKLLAELSAGQQRLVNGRVVWISSASPSFSLRGVRARASVRFASRRFKLAAPFPLGLNDWYLARDGPVTAVLKARDGVVQEIGIANKPLTSGRAAERRFLSSFS